MDCHGNLYCSLLVGENKYEFLPPIMTVLFIAQIVLHIVGVVKSDSKNRGTEIAKYYFYQAPITKNIFTILSSFDCKIMQQIQTNIEKNFLHISES
jgi:hypothetical protein